MDSYLIKRNSIVNSIISKLRESSYNISHSKITADDLQFPQILYSSNEKDLFVGNSEDFGKIDNESILILFGPQSCGKSILTLMTIETKEFNSIFPSGSIWLNFGDNSYTSPVIKRYQLIIFLLNEIRNKCDASSGDLISSEFDLFYSYEECKFMISQYVNNHELKILLVLDGVGSIEDIIEFSYLGLQTVVTTRHNFPQFENDYSIISISENLCEHDKTDFVNEYGQLFSKNLDQVLNRSVFELSLILQMEESVIPLEKNKNIYEIYIESLPKEVSDLLLTLGYFEENIPLSFELLSQFWDLSLELVTAQVLNLMYIGMGHIGHGDYSFLLHSNFHAVLYKKLRSHSNYSIKSDIGVKLLKYLKSKASFRSEEFERNNLHLMIYCWKEVELQVEDVKHFRRVINEIFSYSNIADNNLTNMFSEAENISILCTFLLSQDLKQEFFEMYYNLCIHKLELYGTSSKEVISSLSKLYRHYFCEGGYDHHPRASELLKSLVESVGACYGTDTVLVYSVFKEIGHFLCNKPNVSTPSSSSSTDDNDAITLFENVISSEYFQSKRFAPESLVFLESYAKSIHDNQKLFVFTTFLHKICDECPKVIAYDLIRSYLLHILALVFEKRSKVDKVYEIRTILCTSFYTLFGLYHPSTIQSLHFLAETIEKYDISTDLLPLVLNKIFQARSCIYGIHHPSLHPTILNVSKSKEKAGDYQAAIEYLKNILNSKRANSDLVYQDIIPLLEALGKLYLNHQLPKEAVIIFQRIVKIYDKSEEALNYDQFLIKAKVNCLLGSAYYILGSKKKAIACYSTSLPIFDDICYHFKESIFIDMVRAYLFLGEAFYEDEQYVLSIENFNKSLPFLNKLYSLDNPIIQDVMSRLEIVQKALGSTATNSITTTNTTNTAASISNQQESIEEGENVENNKNVSFDDSATQELESLNETTRDVDKIVDHNLIYDVSRSCIYSVIDAIEFSFIKLNNEEKDNQNVCIESKIESESNEVDNINEIVVSSSSSSSSSSSACELKEIEIESVHDHHHHDENQLTFSENVSIISLEDNFKNQKDSEAFYNKNNYNNNFKFDYFYYSSEVASVDEINYDENNSLDELLTHDAVPIFIYGFQRTKLSKHHELEAIIGISFVYTSSTCDLFSMVIEKKTGNVSVVELLGYFNPSDYRRASQIVGELYLCPSDSLSQIDVIYGSEYSKVSVKVRHSANHYITALIYANHSIDLSDDSSFVRVPNGNLKDFIKIHADEDGLHQFLTLV